MKVKILAHRGLHHTMPENSLSAFREAFNEKIDGIECDIQKTLDGRYAVIHDEQTGRVADRNDRVAGVTMSELKNCRLGENDTVPELEELLSILPKDAFFDLELKAETISFKDFEPVFQLLTKYVPSENLMVSSFSAELLKPYIERKIKTGLLVGNEHAKMGLWRFIRLILDLRPAFLNLPVQLFAEAGNFGAKLAIFIFRILGFHLAFWTINTPNELLKVRKYAEFIITDNPREMADLINK